MYVKSVRTQLPDLRNALLVRRVNIKGCLNRALAHLALQASMLPVLVTAHAVFVPQAKFQRLAPLLARIVHLVPIKMPQVNPLA